MPAEGGPVAPAHVSRRDDAGARMDPRRARLVHDRCEAREPRRLLHLHHRSGQRCSRNRSTSDQRRSCSTPPTAAASCSVDTRSIPRAGSATAAAHAATSGSTATGERTVPATAQPARQPRLPDVGRRPHLLPVRSRRHRQPLLVHADRCATSAGTPTTTTYYARWAQTATASASCTRSPPRSGSTTRQTDTSERDRRRPAQPAHRAQPPVRRRRQVPAQAWRVHNEGHSIAVNTRGKIFTMPLWEQAPRQYGQRDGVRYRHRAVDVCDGESSCASPTKAARRPSRSTRPRTDHARSASTASTSDARVEMHVSPTADAGRHREPPQRIDLGGPRRRTAARSSTAASTVASSRPVWSPDGRFVAYSCAETERTTSIKLVRARVRHVRRW